MEGYPHYYWMTFRTVFILWMNCCFKQMLLQTDTGYGKYLSYYMKDVVTGENNRSDGLLLGQNKKMTERWKDSGLWSER